MVQTGPAPKRAQRLKLKILDAPQRRLWSELTTTPHEFTLYGGTALALQLGHRKSVDFDFFSTRPFDTADLLAIVPYLEGARITQQSVNTLSVIVERDGDIRVSFFTPDRPLTRIGASVTCNRPRLTIASKIHIAATKLAVLAARPAAKDYFDIHALITKAGIGLEWQLAAVPSVFVGQHFNPYVTLKSLAYFEDGDLPALPDNVKQDLSNAVAAVDLDKVKLIVQRARAEPGIWNDLP